MKSPLPFWGLDYDALLFQIAKEKFVITTMGKYKKGPSQGPCVEDLSIATFLK